MGWRKKKLKKYNYFSMANGISKKKGNKIETRENKISMLVEF